MKTTTMKTTKDERADTSEQCLACGETYDNRSGGTCGQHYHEDKPNGRDFCLCENCIKDARDSEIIKGHLLDTDLLHTDDFTLLFDWAKNQSLDSHGSADEVVGTIGQLCGQPDKATARPEFIYVVTAEIGSKPIIDCYYSSSVQEWNDKDHHVKIGGGWYPLAELTAHASQCLPDTQKVISKTEHAALEAVAKSHDKMLELADALINRLGDLGITKDEAIIYNEANKLRANLTKIREQKAGAK